MGRQTKIAPVRAKGNGLERAGTILYRLLRAVAVCTTLVGAYWGYWAPDAKIVVFMLFATPAIALLLFARLLRRADGGVLKQASTTFAPKRAIPSSAHYLADH